MPSHDREGVGSAEDAAAAGDGSLIAITKFNRATLIAIAASVATIAGAAIIVSNAVRPATATAVAPVYGEGTTVALSTDLAGNLRTAGGGGGGNPTGGRLDSLRRLDSVYFLRVLDTLHYLKAGRLDSTAFTRRASVDTLRYLLAGRLDSLRRLDTLRTLANQLAGRMDSIRRLDTVRVVANILAGRLDSLRRLDSLFGIRANMTHIGRVAVDSAIPELRAATLHVTGTAAVNTALTITLPAVAGQFHYITSIQWHKLYSVVGVAAGAGVICTTTNLPGNPAWTTEQNASPAGTVVKVIDYQPTTPLKSSVVNTATTIVCPLQLQTIWRGNVSYFTAP